MYPYGEAGANSRRRRHCWQQEQSKNVVMYMYILLCNEVSQKAEKQEAMTQFVTYDDGGFFKPQKKHVAVYSFLPFEWYLPAKHEK